jgi:hypothetical protein
MTERAVSKIVFRDIDTTSQLQSGVTFELQPYDGTAVNGSDVIMDDEPAATIY